MKIRKLGLIGSTYRHAARYRQILSILAKYGFGDLVERLHIERYVELGYQLISRERRETIESILLDKAKTGHVKIEFEHRRLEPMIDCMDRMSDILSFAIVQGSLVIGSSIMVLSGIPPHWKGIPLIGVFGFIVAGLMGFRYLMSLHRSAKI